VPLRDDGPEDFEHRGWGRIDSIDGPHRIEFSVGPSGADGEPIPEAGSMSGVVTFEPIGVRTRMSVLTQFADTEQMEQMIDGGLEEACDSSSARSSPCSSPLMPAHRSLEGSSAWPHWS
jgi:uncharacterized protein YndB with AHSA1/START domain